ncbi:uncharacterized protein LOC134836108 [Culicoides brevitarsis]|uniref:uncharacterized protein LOC134836108 n=1 Tax=Culicoides brevitarsis TaxID=469753 RepID=UPI00307CB88B
MARHVVTIVCFVCVIYTAGAQIKPEWEKPDAWSRHRSAVLAREAKENALETQNSIAVIASKSCAEDLQSQQELSTIFYKRLAQLLFKEKKFKETELGFVTRSIEIKLEKDRLHLINSLIDGDDDGQLTELDDQIIRVLQESEGGFAATVKDEILTVFEIIFQYLRDKNVQAFLYSVFFFILLPLLFKRFGWNMAISIIFILLFVGFVVQYMECNKQKEGEQIIRFKKIKDPSKTPCEGVDLSEDTWFEYLVTWFGFSGKQGDCIKYIRETAKLDLDVCLPDEVLIQYFCETLSNIVLRLFGSIIDRFHETTKNYSIPGRIFAFAIFLSMMIICAYFFFGMTIPNILIHGLREIFSGRRRNSDANERHSIKNQEKSSSKEDHLKELIKVTKLLAEQNQIQTRNALEGRYRKPLRRKRITENRIEDLTDEEETDGPKELKEKNEEEEISVSESNFEDTSDNVEELKAETTIIKKTKVQ